MNILCGDVVEVLKECPDNRFDALFCDPPYSLRMMGMKWDYSLPSPEAWAECYRVLKPGAYILAFGGCRTFHRLACGIEDAGFEIKDTLMWVFAKAMPKPATTTERYLRKTEPFGPMNEHNRVRLEMERWDGYGHALKPGYEPIIMARKPLDGSIAENVIKHDVGGLNIKACRIGNQVNAINRWDDSAHPFGGGAGNTYTPIEVTGRWPANLILDEEAGALLDEQSGQRPSTLSGRADPTKSYTNPGDNNGKSSFGGGNSSVYADSGGASRFFYCTKVNGKERNAGCEEFPLRSPGECTEPEEDTIGLGNGMAGAGRTSGHRNPHPTLKPMSLTTYLAKLILPPSRETEPRRILVPFAGTASEMIGCAKAGWDKVVGIERDEEYVKLAEARMRHWRIQNDESTFR